MEQIYLNTTEKLYFRIYVGGTLTNADGAVEVTVVDSLGVTLRTLTASVESTGVYYVYTLLAETVVEQTLTYNWGFVINGETATQSEVVEVVTPYISIGDIRTVAPADTSYEELKNAETFARFNIIQYTGQEFGERARVITQEGNGQETLVLPHRIVRLDRVDVNDESVWTRDPVYNEFGLTPWITDTNYGLRAKRYENTPAWGDFTTGPTWKKKTFYSIHGNFGWDNVPAQVSYCAKILADDYFCKETSWKKRFVEQINASDWRVVFNQKQFQGTGNFYVDQILHDYRSIGMVIV